MSAVSTDMFDLPEPPSDARLLELAAQVRTLQAELRRQEASATENAKLFAQAHARLRELTALNKVSRAITSTWDVHELLSTALQQTVQVADADTGSVMLMEPGTGDLKIAVAHGLSGDIVEGARVHMGDGVAGWVAKNNRPILVPNVATDPRFHLVTPRYEIKSAMSVPLATKREVLGVLNVARSSSSRPFTAQDLQLLTTLAGQISLSVENVRLFEAIHRRNEELSILMDLGHQLNATLNLHEVLDIVVEQSCAILHADACALFLRDDRNDVLRSRATRHLSTNFFRKVRGKMGHGLIGDVAVSGVPQYVEDIGAAPTLEYADIQTAEGMSSLLLAPLRIGGQALGALAVYSKTTRHWEDHELNMFTSIAGQGAIAIHNAENYQQQRGIAELVQRNLTPQVHISSTGIEVGHRYLPAKQVGGDYYDVFDLEAGRTGILMADVAGKSVTAAVHTAKGKYFIRALGHTSASPAEVMAQTNALIHGDTSIETFISVFYAVLDADSRTLHYSNAGHPAPIVLHADGSLSELANADILLGILPDPPFTESTFTLEPGDTLILTTDGVTEAKGENGLYGSEKLKECLLNAGKVSVQALADCITEDVLNYSGTRMRDDIAVLPSTSAKAAPTANMIYSALFLNARHAAPREDALAVDTERRIFIAADGVTRDWDALAEGRCPYPNPSPATLAADAVADTSLRWVQQSADDGSSNVLLVADALRAANEAVDHINVSLHLYESCDYLEHDLAGAVAAVAEISGDTLTTGWVGDCGVAVVRAGQLVFLTRDQVEDTITHLRANPAPFNDQRRAYVRRELRNRPDVAHPSIITYGVLTGEREAMRYIETASFDLQPGDVVATHTDGFRPYFANRDFLALLSDQAARWESDIPAFTLELAERDREYGRERSIVLYKHAG